MSETSGSIQKKKKGFKHSKKFARSQKGCLQCRQKKKKCDMRKPQCLSCEKRGVSCEFPENIRIFQIESFQMVDPKGSSEGKTKSPKMKVQEIKFDKNHTPNVSPPPVKSERKGSATIPPSQPTDPSQQTTTQFLQNIPSPILSHSQTLDHSQSNYHFPHVETHETQGSSMNQLLSILNTNSSNTDTAISLATEGQSIKSILDSSAIDLLKRSIESLQYISLEKQRKEYITQRETFEKQQEQIKQHAILDALKFGGLGSLSVSDAQDEHPSLSDSPHAINVGHESLTNWEHQNFRLAGWHD